MSHMALRAGLAHGAAAPPAPIAIGSRVRRAESIRRVVIVSDDAVASGGAAAIMLASARALVARRIPVTLLAGGGARDPSLAEAGVEVVDLGGRHLLEGPRLPAMLRGLHDRGVRARISDWIQRHDAPGTVYHLHNWHKVLSPSALAALRPVARRLVATAHDFFLACPNGGYFDYRTDTLCTRVPLSTACLATNCDKRSYAEKLWRTARHLARLRAIDLARAGATVVAVHEGMVPLLVRGGIPEDVVRVVRNPVSPWLRERVPAEANRGALYVGRIEHDKGVDVLLAAARLAGVPVTLVGDGPLLADLRARHPEARFTGRLGHPAIAGLARGARFVALPTRVRETFGLVALEAAGSGLPVVATTSTLIAGEIEGHGFGLCCPPADPAALAAAMASLAADDARVAAMSHAGIARAPSLAPDRDRWIDALLAIYRSKLESPTEAALP